MAIGLLPFFLAAQALQTLGALQQSRAQVDALAGQAAAAESEASLTEISAEWAARRSQEASSRALGEIRARIAASGLPIAGSPLEVLAEATRQAELDVQAIQVGGALRARGLRQEAAGSRREARRTGRAGTLTALTSVVQAGGAFGAAGGFEKLGDLWQVFRPGRAVRGTYSGEWA